MEWESSRLNCLSTSTLAVALWMAVSSVCPPLLFDLVFPLPQRQPLSQVCHDIDIILDERC